MVPVYLCLAGSGGRSSPFANNTLTQTATTEQVNELTVRKQNAGKPNPGLSQRPLSRR